MQLGLAHLGKQNALRYLASFQVIPETDKYPSLNLSAGVQGIGTGNPGYSATAEKAWTFPIGDVVAYGGIGFRSNESHAHGLFGFKFTYKQIGTIGLQHDGHQAHAFLLGQRGSFFGGFYLIKMSRPALMAGVRF